MIINYLKVKQPHSFEPMKTKLFIIFAVGMVSNAMFGQISLRPYAGVNLSKFSYEESENMTAEELQLQNDATKFKTGFNVGIDINFPINEVFSIETGLGYMQRGTNFLREEVLLGLNLIYDANVRIGYLGIPIMLKVQKEVGDFKLSIFGGPSLLQKLDYKEKYKIEYNDGLVDYVEVGEIIENNEIKNFDFNLNFGTSVEYGKFNLGLTYLHGLSDITLGNGVKNSSVLINLGYRIEL